MAQALYRKYRSKSLDQVVGQDHITKILSRAIKQGRVAHAYLFTGPRGVGKTSVARILAYEINKFTYDEMAHHLDIIEIDAASNNGVEDIRSLREKVQVAPVSAAKKSISSTKSTCYRHRHLTRCSKRSRSHQNTSYSYWRRQTPTNYPTPSSAARNDLTSTALGKKISPATLLQ